MCFAQKNGGKTENGFTNFYLENLEGIRWTKNIMQKCVIISEVSETGYWQSVVPLKNHCCGDIMQNLEWNPSKLPLQLV